MEKGANMQVPEPEPRMLILPCVHDPVVSFKVHGNPVPQGRPRIIKKGQHYGAKDPDTSRVYKDRLRLLAHEHRQEPLLEGPLFLRLTFEVLKPKSARKRDVWRHKKPDLDNLVKAVMDAMVGVMYRDDAQIVGLESYKLYSASPGVTLELWTLSDEKEEVG